jgi:hypothetical protein
VNDKSLIERPDHDRRMAAARQYATWYLGTPSWADSIIAAYLNPEAALEAVRRGKARYDTPASERQGSQ